MKRLSKEEYLTRLKEIQPELQIVGEYKGANIKIRVKDRLGINYLCKPYNLLAGKVPNLSSAVNKTLAYNTRLNQVFSNLVVDNYEDGKTKVLVTDIPLIDTIKSEKPCCGITPKQALQIIYNKAK